MQALYHSTLSHFAYHPTLHLYVRWLTAQKRTLKKRNFAKLINRKDPWRNPFLADRVARWYIFRPKFAIWVYFGVPCNGMSVYLMDFWCYLQPFDIFYGHEFYGNLVFYSHCW
jgi:hypothetical protein